MNMRELNVDDLYIAKSGMYLQLFIIARVVYSQIEKEMKGPNGWVVQAKVIDSNFYKDEYHVMHEKTEKYGNRTITVMTIDTNPEYFL